jgi:hypothetical protein
VNSGVPRRQFASSLLITHLSQVWLIRKSNLTEETFSAGNLVGLMMKQVHGGLDAKTSTVTFTGS